MGRSQPHARKRSPHSIRLWEAAGCWSPRRSSWWACTWTRSLTNSRTLGSSVQSTRDTQGGSELTSFRARQLTLSEEGKHWPVRHCSTHLTNSSPWDLPPTAFHTSCMPWLVLRIFLKFLKGKQTPNKQWLTSVCCSALAKWCQAWHNEQPVLTCIVTPVKESQTRHY